MIFLIIRMTNDSKPENEYNHQNQFEEYADYFLLESLLTYFFY